MSKDLNSVVLVGRLVKDPEVRYTPSGTPVARISIANGERIKQNNEWTDFTNFFDVTIWGNQASNCEKYLRKGSQIAINGSLRQNRWTDPATNQTRSRVEVIANSIQFLSPASGQNMQGGQVNYPQNNNSGVANMPTQPSTPKNNGFIPDPWGDAGTPVSSDVGDPFGGVDNIDDIPF